MTWRVAEVSQAARGPATGCRARLRVAVVVRRAVMPGRLPAVVESDEHPREDDRDEEVEDSPAPDPEQGVTAEDDPEAD
jgi:hypothetical protein